MNIIARHLKLDQSKLLRFGGLLTCNRVSPLSLVSKCEAFRSLKRDQNSRASVVGSLAMLSENKAKAPEVFDTIGWKLSDGLSDLDLNMGIEQSSCLGPLTMKLADEVRLTTPLPLLITRTLTVDHVRASFGKGRSLDDDSAIEIMPQHLVSSRIPQDVSRRNVAVQDARRVDRLQPSQRLLLPTISHGDRLPQECEQIQQIATKAEHQHMYDRDPAEIMKWSGDLSNGEVVRSRYTWHCRAGILALQSAPTPSSICRQTISSGIV